MSHASLAHPRGNLLDGQGSPGPQRPPSSQSSETVGQSIRSELIRTLARLIERQRLTRPAAAKLLGITTKRVGELLRGDARAFSIDALVKMVARSGGTVKLKVQQGPAGR